MMCNNELVRDRALYVHVRQMYNHVVSSFTPEISDKYMTIVMVM